jgi:zinc carboxypeptidase
MRIEEIFAFADAVVPTRRELMTLDELEASTRALAERFPSAVRLEEIGRSSEGRPIEMMTIGTGKRRALLVGVPHPNEPIGTLTLETVSAVLAEQDALRDALDWTFSIIKVADPDGLRLNHGWLKPPFSLVSYALNYYRSPPHEQVEWGFPIHYKTLRFEASPPETRAVMAAIERFKPDLLYSLHNASFCGVYFYTSKRLDPLFDGLTRSIAREGLPIHRGEPEVPYIEPYADGMYPLFGIRDTYDFLATNMREDPARHITSGASSHDHLERIVPGAFSLVSELPYFTDPALDDHRPSPISRRDALAEGLRRIGDTLIEVEKHFRALERDHQELPWREERIRRAVADWLARTPKRLAAQRQSLASPTYAVKATRAQAFDAMVCKSFHAILVLGETYRLAGELGETGRADEIRAKVEAGMKRITDEGRLEVLPLEKLVRVQMEALFLALRAL